MNKTMIGYRDNVAIVGFPVLARGQRLDSFNDGRKAGSKQVNRNWVGGSGTETDLKSINAADGYGFGFSENDFLVEPFSTKRSKWLYFNAVNGITVSL